MLPLGPNIKYFKNVKNKYLKERHGFFREVLFYKTDWKVALADAELNSHTFVTKEKCKASIT